MPSGGGLGVTETKVRREAIEDTHTLFTLAKKPTYTRYDHAFACNVNENAQDLLLGQLSLH